jgi:hypothetical protein
MPFEISGIATTHSYAGTAARRRRSRATIRRCSPRQRTHPPTNEASGATMLSQSRITAVAATLTPGPDRGAEVLITTRHRPPRQRTHPANEWGLWHNRTQHLAALRLGTRLSAPGPATHRRHPARPPQTITDGTTTRSAHARYPHPARPPIGATRRGRRKLLPTARPHATHRSAHARNRLSRPARPPIGRTSRPPQNITDPRQGTHPELRT